MKQKNEVRGRDLAAPVSHITLNGQRYELAFTNRAARVAEDVYDEIYGKDASYVEILKELSRFKYKAIMAVFYGALVAGGSDMSWEQFDETFKLDSIEGVREIILKGVTDSLPKADQEGMDESPQ